MKMTQLKDIIREIINEEIAAMDEDSEAAKQAKQQGLTNMGFGRWGKDGEVKAVSDKGKLVPFTKKAMQNKTGMTFGRGKNADTMYSPKTYAPVAKMSEPGKVQRLAPKRAPETDRARNKPKDDLATSYTSLNTRSGTSAAGRKIVSKVTDKFYDSSIADDWGTYDTPIPMTDFENITGITRQAAKYFSDTVDDMETPFDYDADTDSVTIYDPQDI
jgi:hypothetical protein